MRRKIKHFRPLMLKNVCILNYDKLLMIRCTAKTRNNNTLLRFQFKPLGRVIKKGIKRKSPYDVSFNSRPKKKVAVEVDFENSGSIRGIRRRSARICGKVYTLLYIYI